MEFTNYFPLPLGGRGQGEGEFNLFSAPINKSKAL